MSYELHHGCVLDVLPTLAAASVQCCVTSPPYWGLRDYGTPGQLGLERTPEEYVSRMVEVFREVRRVLRDDGTLWLNLGDSYGTRPYSDSHTFDPKYGGPNRKGGYPNRQTQPGVKHKDLIGVPWRVAFALQADGWYLRSDIIWHKPNPMPESVRDRPTKAHEYVFLLAKQERYFYYADAIKEAVTGNAHARGNGVNPKCVEPGTGVKQNSSFSGAVSALVDERNKRSVWTIATQAYPEAHFATFPEALVTPCVLAGSRMGDTILDPFAGSGTVGVVALRHQRSFVGIDLNAEYVGMARRRIYDDAPLLNGTL